MKISRSFKQMLKLATEINKAKEKAKDMLTEIDTERDSLDTLESDVKTVLKL